VGSQKISNGKRKGSGNTKNGNKYLAWAFVEAANFAVRFNPQIRRFYQRKKAKTTPTWGAIGFVNPYPLDAVWYRQFSGAREIARGRKVVS